MKRPNIGERGFTLVEMIFVLAIVLTLIAIFLPLATTKLSEANVAKTRADQDALAAALTAFFSDVGIWPASDGGGANDQDLRYLLVGDGGATITSANPSVGGAGWATGTGLNQISSATVPTGAQATSNNAFRHLVVNDSNPDGTDNSTNDYRSTGNKRWRGPYIAKISTDPFGNNYVINVGAITGKGTGTGPTEKGWILSAGPDGTLNTAATDSAFSSDDIGFIYCTKC